MREDMDSLREKLVKLAARLRKGTTTIFLDGKPSVHKPSSPDDVRDANAIFALLDEVDRLRETNRKLGTVAALLLQNSIGCAVNHYGIDGLPGWLADAERDIAAALIAHEDTAK